jgi:ribonuclease T2
MSGKFIFKSAFAMLFGVLLCFVAASLVDARGHGSRGGDSRPGHFDYYLTSLSWSPSYCALHPDEPQQCGSKGYGFVLHGLWPQNRNGSWPEHCKANGAGPSEETIARTLAIMPSRHLIEHEWETHGACTGLDAKTYFDMADDAFSRIEIPRPLKTPKTPPSLSAAEIVQAFSDVNPGLDETMMTVECRNGSELEEVRICVDKDNLSVKACGGRVRNSCRVGKLTIPAVR